MPSNIPAKTAGVKKPSNAKNVSRTSTAEANKPFASQPETTKPLEPTKSNQAAGRSSPQNVPAGQASSLSYFPQETPGDTHGYRGVNKKKQKRRNKEAAKKAAEQPPMTGSQFADSAYQVTVKERAASQTRSRSNGYDFGGSDYDDPEQFEPDEGEDASWEYGDRYAPPQTNGHAVHDYSLVGLPGSKSKKKKKTKSSSASQATYSAADPLPSSNLRPFQPPPPPPPPALGQPLAGTHQSTRHVSKDRIWNTSTAEERERIKEFWLSLGEEDRRSLVKVEKEAVLKKMKEQQKHSCSCTVCGRKRTAIEEELEVLYDAYYEELEQYANDQHINLEDGTPIIAPPQIYAHPITRISPSRHPQPPNGRSSRSRIQEIGEDDEIAEEDDYSDEEEDDEISEDEAVEAPVGPAADFFNFGNNITVQGTPPTHPSSHHSQCADYF